MNWIKKIKLQIFLLDYLKDEAARRMFFDDWKHLKSKKDPKILSQGYRMLDYVIKEKILQ